MREFAVFLRKCLNTFGQDYRCSFRDSVPRDNKIDVLQITQCPVASMFQKT